MYIIVKIIGNLPFTVKGLQRQYDNLQLADGAKLSDLFESLALKQELLAISEGRRLLPDALLWDGMEITIVSPSVGG